MIERQFIKQKLKEFQVEEYFKKNLSRVGFSHIKIQRTPLGDKVVIFASRPGLVIGRQGANIKSLTKVLKNKFKLENPQIEIGEVENPNIDPNIIAENVVNSLERFGSQGFKGIGHRVMSDVMGSKALGVEVVISGKIPSSRAKVWRFYTGYLKKCGDIAVTGVFKAHRMAKLKSGVVGIKVSIMPASTKLPDNIQLLEEPITVVEEITEEKEIEKINEEVVKSSETSPEDDKSTEVKSKPKSKESNSKEAKPTAKKAAKKVVKAETNNASESKVIKDEN